MSTSSHGPKTLTREGLKEILRVNFELYKDEPDFYDYITTLVIYLMEYEYKRDDIAPYDYSLPHRHEEAAPKTAPTLPTRYTVREGFCPHCNNPVPSDRNICPYCLAMIEH